MAYYYAKFTNTRILSRKYFQPLNAAVFLGVDKENIQVNYSYQQCDTTKLHKTKLSVLYAILLKENYCLLSYQYGKSW